MAIVCLAAPAAASASTGVTTVPLSASLANHEITFSYKIAAGVPSAILVDFNDDGVSDHVISADGDAAYSAGVSASTLTCQQYWGPDQWDAPAMYDVDVRSAAAEDTVSFTIDDTRLRTKFEAKAV